MTNLGKILVVDDNPDVLVAARLLLKPHAILVHTEKDPESIPSLLRAENYDIILLDMNFEQDTTSGEEGLLWLDKIQEIDPNVIVILITAYGDVELAVKAIKQGATDFCLKPWQNEKLLATLSMAMNLRESRLEVLKLKDRQKQMSADQDLKFHDMIGTSSAMQQVFATIEKVAKTEASVLIIGENGTGKELVARAVHRQSSRASEAFISVDMGAITETLFESEMFGYKKGAFTDAKEDRAGRLEIASGGTLFLDEIGNLSLPLQGKLLRVLEERQVTRVGSTKAHPFDIRLICATNRPIYDMIRNQEFRQDLLYRINTVEITIPPLRDRIEDIPLLIEHFLKIYTKKYNSNIRSLSTGTMKKLKTYQWPGNVRELRHAVERAVILSDSRVLQPSDFLLKTDDQWNPETYDLESIEKNTIRRVLDKNQGNISRSAHELGLTRTSLYRRMQKHGL